MQRPIQNPKHPIPEKPLNEPLEILREAGQQLTGEQSKEIQSQRPEESTPQQPVQQSPEDRKKYVRMQAFRAELREIDKIRQQREQEQMKAKQEAEFREQQAAEEASKSNSFLEPVARLKRGMLGGGPKKGMKAKVENDERKTERGKATQQ